MTCGPFLLDNCKQPSYRFFNILYMDAGVIDNDGMAVLLCAMRVILAQTGDMNALFGSILNKFLIA